MLRLPGFSLLAAVFVLGASPAAAQAPPEPLPVTFLAGGATAGGCRAQWQTVAAVGARSAPTDAAATTRTIEAQRRVDANDYSEALTAVLEPGRVRLRAAVSVGTNPALRLSSGDELRVLATTGDLTTFAYGGRVYTARLGEVETLQTPVAEVWVFLLPREDRPAAWLNTAQAGVVRWDPVCAGQ